MDVDTDAAFAAHGDEEEEESENEQDESDEEESEDEGTKRYLALKEMMGGKRKVGEWALFQRSHDVSVDVFGIAPTASKVERDSGPQILLQARCPHSQWKAVCWTLLCPLLVS
jgi:hypothetical protein